MGWLTSERLAHALDFVFAPIGWLWSLLKRLASPEASELQLKVLFALLLILGLAIAMISLYLLARESRFFASSIRTYASRGANLKTMQRMANRLAVTDAFFLRVQIWTGVRVGLAESRDRQMPRDLRTGSLAVRALFSWPFLVASAIGALFTLVKKPVVLYLIVGLWWTWDRPSLEPVVFLLDSLGRFLSEHATATVVTFAGIALAVVALGLDHAIAPRRRGRNAFAVQSAGDAAARLALMGTAAEVASFQLSKVMHSLIDTYGAVVVNAAVEFASNGSYGWNRSGLSTREGRSHGWVSSHRGYKIDWNAWPPSVEAALFSGVSRRDAEWELMRFSAVVEERLAFLQVFDQVPLSLRWFVHGAYRRKESWYVGSCGLSDLDYTMYRCVANAKQEWTASVSDSEIVRQQVLTDLALDSYDCLRAAMEPMLDLQVNLDRFSRMVRKRQSPESLMGKMASRVR